MNGVRRCTSEQHDYAQGCVHLVFRTLRRTEGLPLTVRTACLEALSGAMRQVDVRGVRLCQEFESVCACDEISVGVNYSLETEREIAARICDRWGTDAR